MLRPLVGVWFQELFHSPRGRFHLSFTVLVRYRSLGVFSLTGWSRQIRAGFLVSPPYSRIPLCFPFRLPDHHRSVMVFLPNVPVPILHTMSRSTTPAIERLVWAVPRSLATTGESLFIFSSCRLRCFSSTVASNLEDWIIRFNTGLSHSKSPDQRSFTSP